MAQRKSIMSRADIRLDLDELVAHDLSALLRDLLERLLGLVIGEASGNRSAGAGEERGIDDVDVEGDVVVVRLRDAGDGLLDPHTEHPERGDHLHSHPLALIERPGIGAEAADPERGQPRNPGELDRSPERVSVSEPHETSAIAEVEVGVEVNDMNLSLDAFVSPHHGKGDGVIAPENHRKGLLRQNLLHGFGDAIEVGHEVRGHDVDVADVGAAHVDQIPFTLLVVVITGPPLLPRRRRTAAAGHPAE
jgi:hypothetical protein